MPPIAAIVLTLSSYHATAVGSTLPYVNPGIGIAYRHAEAGVYRNSHGRASVYGLATVERRIAAPLSIGFSVGAVTGYRLAVMPIVFPFVVIGRSRVKLKIGALPVRRFVLGFQLRLEKR